MSVHRCQEREMLERVVILAVQKLYDAKDAARMSLRTEESNAVKALQAHVDAHGCGDVKPNA